VPAGPENTPPFDTVVEGLVRTGDCGWLNPPGTRDNLLLVLPAPRTDVDMFRPWPGTALRTLCDRLTPPIPFPEKVEVDVEGEGNVPAVAEPGLGICIELVPARGRTLEVWLLGGPIVVPES
jgi:hypothetical protein